MDGVESGDEEVEIRSSVLDDGSYQNDQIVEPKVGMKFNDAEELFEFYSRYAYKKGFSCKKRTCKKEDGILRFVTYSCTKEGKNQTVSNSPLNLPPT
ncbi:hypothetical protein MKX03_033860 [Papaver bracteatum]|nr:hypothetical protein MKX03_033860 [Papaver bracteatum]